MSVRALDAADNEALLALGRRRTTGRQEFRVDRAPDFFALGRRFGDTTVYGAFRGGALVGSMSVSKQRRFVCGMEVLARYVHDLRTDPDADKCALLGLARDVLQTELRSSSWAFATVLSGNPVEAGLVSVMRRMFGCVRPIGTVAHVALASGRASALDVAEVDAETGVSLYARWAPRRCFAPADPRGWSNLSGCWLVASRAGEPIGVTLAAHETDRRVVATTDDRPVNVGYLAFMCTDAPEDDEDVEAALVAHVSKAKWASWDLICRGRAAREPARGRVLFESTTYVCGPAPSDLYIELPELTLV